MPKQPKFIKIATLLLAVMLTAQACNAGKPAAEKITLIWWKTFDDYRQVQPLVEAFQKTHSNIQITFVQKNIETYEDELVDALASGNGPDIFSIHNDWLPKHKSKLSPAPEKIFSLRKFKEDFVQVATADLVDEDQIYAVPLSIDVLAMYYNKDFLATANIARPPATWQELVTNTPRLTRQDNIGNFERSAVALGTADNVNRAPDILSLLMLQNGTTFYNPTRDVSNLNQTITDETGKTYNPAARALEFYTQFASPQKLSYTWNNKNNNSIEAFANSQVALIFSYAYLRDTLATKAPFLNYGIAAIPQIDSQNKVNFANYWAEAVAKQSKHPEAAWQFLQYITSKDVLAKYSAEKKQVSSRLDLIEQQISDKDIGIFAENALSTKSFYKPNSDGVEKIFTQMIGDVVLRSISPADAVQAASQKINLLLRNSP